MKKIKSDILPAYVGITDNSDSIREIIVFLEIEPANWQIIKNEISSEVKYGSIEKLVSEDFRRQMELCYLSALNKPWEVARIAMEETFEKYYSEIMTHLSSMLNEANDYKQKTRFYDDFMENHYPIV